jgi:hypothetical protein
MRYDRIAFNSKGIDLDFSTPELEPSGFLIYFSFISESVLSIVLRPWTIAGRPFALAPPDFAPATIGHGRNRGKQSEFRRKRDFHSRGESAISAKIGKSAGTDGRNRGR